MANGPAMEDFAGARGGETMSCMSTQDHVPVISGDAARTRDVITEVSREEALLKTGALQNAIFNSANFSSIATDEKGVIQIFNVGAERMLGYAAADVVNKITPADISDPLELIARAVALSAELATTITPGFQALVFKASRGIEDIYELTYIRQDGTRFPAVVSVTALRDDQGAIIGYLLIGTDNSARKQVEAEQMKLDQRLRDQQFYTRSLIESNIDAIMTTDPAGIITDVNKQMEALTGCTRDELIGAPFKSYFTDPERAKAAIKLVLREKKLTNYELTACSRDGKTTVVSYNATTFYDRDRQLQGVFAAARDVTERKLLDQALQEQNVELKRARGAAEKANLAKSDFLSSMSHELRSPLNAILGFAQLINSDSPPPTPSQAASIDQILHAGWYLLQLINEILDLAQIESGRMALSLEPTSLTEVMFECQAMIEPQAQKRGIKMTFPQFDLPCFVDADRTRLKQVLINLISNAIKYNRPDGTVAVEVNGDGNAAKRTRVSVKDTGAGLPPDMLMQLFQPFNRLGRERSTEEGTGIGLVMSKRLVELMGGEIGVESTVGSGSVFWFELNSAAAPQLAVDGAGTTADPQAQVPHGAPLRTLLYVEDNPANLMLIEQLIKRRPDMRLLSASDGNLGIQLARANQPEVILMDINLPGISGIEALRILREDPATAHIPVVALSANAMPRDVEKGLQAGFFRYLTKPIKVNEFMQTLDVALEFARQEAGYAR
ncbi:MAG: PAS domain S-box protein [Candidatus Solibacter sp.]|jgi:PAS domain S-box-containing protein